VRHFPSSLGFPLCSPPLPRVGRRRRRRRDHATDAVVVCGRRVRRRRRAEPRARRLVPPLRRDRPPLHRPPGRPGSIALPSVLPTSRAPPTLLRFSPLTQRVRAGGWIGGGNGACGAGRRRPMREPR
jgi:hypothetical protein